MQKDKGEHERANQDFIEGIDFYFDEGLMVLTEKYLLDRQFCCESGCRHCPYGFGGDQSKNISSSSRSSGSG